MAPSPDFLAPLAEERTRIERILARLPVTDDLVERADLAGELVRSLSRYEDTLERAVRPRVAESDADAVRRLDEERDQLRLPMALVHERTMHVAPRNVHAPDPQGFEDALAEIGGRAPSLLADEDRALSRLDRVLADAEARAALTTEVARAHRKASERPVPPRTAMGRAVANLHVKLDHALEDVAAPQHPGSDTIDG